MVDSHKILEGIGGIVVGFVFVFFIGLSFSLLFLIGAGTAQVEPSSPRRVARIAASQLPSKRPANFIF